MQPLTGELCAPHDMNGEMNFTKAATGAPPTAQERCAACAKKGGASRGAVLLTKPTVIYHGFSYSNATSPRTSIALEWLHEHDSPPKFHRILHRLHTLGSVLLLTEAAAVASSSPT